MLSSVVYAFRKGLPQGVGRWIWKKGPFVVRTTVVVSGGYCLLRYGGSLGGCFDVSMLPTIEDGDVFFISPLPVERKTLKKGDIVFCRSPTNPEHILCKRLLALQHDTVYNTEKGYEEWIDNGHVWLEGDNKDQSVDSRKYGQIPYGLIISKVVARVWPMSRFGSFNTSYEEPKKKKPQKPASIPNLNIKISQPLLMKNKVGDKPCEDGMADKENTEGIKNKEIEELFQGHLPVVETCQGDAALNKIYLDDKPMVTKLQGPTLESEILSDKNTIREQLENVQEGMAIETKHVEKLSVEICDRQDQPCGDNVGWAASTHFEASKEIPEMNISQNEVPDVILNQKEMPVVETSIAEITDVNTTFKDIPVVETS